MQPQQRIPAPSMPGRERDRAVVGSEFDRRGQATEAKGALEAACITRFGTLRAPGPTPPYTPAQGGMIRGFFRPLQAECVWQHRFAHCHEARRAVRR